MEPMGIHPTKAQEALNSSDGHQTEIEKMALEWTWKFVEGLKKVHNAWSKKLEKFKVLVKTMNTARPVKANLELSDQEYLNFAESNNSNKQYNYKTCC
ncbi:hypothetical protein F8M41_020897 [Gigaspora margarita]|uniref:Uncharacterized protein n=1 Tax=Gigaspora margarita TaxID=4874 RepID=A0A8H3ZU94_GIGMA|nr:hypothetical protein F8M41_020897 [Gigaspora margarita]